MIYLERLGTKCNILEPKPLHRRNGAEKSTARRWASLSQASDGACRPPLGGT